MYYISNQQTRSVSPSSKGYILQCKDALHILQWNPTFIVRRRIKSNDRQTYPKQNRVVKWCVNFSNEIFTWLQHNITAFTLLYVNIF